MIGPTYMYGWDVLYLGGISTCIYMYYYSTPHIRADLTEYIREHRYQLKGDRYKF